MTFPWLRLAPLLAILALLAWCARLEQRRAHWHDQFIAEHDGRIADRAGYAAAQTQAATANRAHVIHVELEQKAVTDDVKNTYASDLAALRSANQRMRDKAVAAVARPTSGAGASGLPVTRSGVADEAMQSDTPDLAYTSEVELQLNALVDWVKRQHEIDPNADKP